MCSPLALMISMPLNKTVPQAKGHFLLGNVLQFKSNPLKVLCDWQREYGDLVGFRLVTQQMYLFSHPRFIEQALIKQNKNFVKMYDPKTPKGLSLVLGQGLVTSQGNLWQRQRRLIQPVFQRRHLTSMLPKMTLAGNKLLNRWHQLGDGSQVILADEMMRLTLEVITQTMFSTSVLDKIEQIAPAIDIGLRYAASSMANPLTPPLYIPTSANQQFKQAMTILDEVIYKLIHQRRAQTNQQQDLLDMLLNAKDPNNQKKMKDQQIRDEVITIFTAGHETTATLLTWTLYLLAKHPDVLEKLRTEQQHLLNGKIPDSEDLQQMMYSRAVLNESMRIRPPVGFLMRKVNKHTKIEGYSIKANSIAVFNIYGIHHHPEFWLQPEQFDPQRFLTPEKRRFAYMPFGTGERVCIGNHFALMESQLLLSMIIQQFDLQLIDDAEVEMEMAVTIKPKNGIPIKLIQR